MFLNANIKYSDFLISDYILIVLEMNNIISVKGRYSFRFEYVWIFNNKEYESIVRKVWLSRVKGSMMFQL